MHRSSQSHPKPLKLLQTHSSCFSADDSMLVTFARDVVVWDVQKRAKRYRVHPISYPSDCDFDPAGTLVAIKTTAGEILTLHAADGSTAQVVDEGSEGEGANLMYSACSRFIVDGS